MSDSKEAGCLRLSVQFACQLRVEWLRQVGSNAGESNHRCSSIALFIADQAAFKVDIGRHGKVDAW